MPAFRIWQANGAYSYLRADDHGVALDEARRQVGVEADVSEDDLRRHWGVTIEEISDEDAKAANP
jgi:hypothetical protein